MEKDKIVFYTRGFVNNLNSVIIDGFYSDPILFSKTRDGLIYDKKRGWVISVLGGISGGETIRVGKLGIDYRTYKLPKFDKHGNLTYKVVRVDGQPITTADVTNAQEGATIAFISRNNRKRIIDELQGIQEC